MKTADCAEEQLLKSLLSGVNPTLNPPLAFAATTGMNPVLSLSLFLFLKIPSSRCLVPMLKCGVKLLVFSFSSMSISSTIIAASSNFILFCTLTSARPSFVHI